MELWAALYPTQKISTMELVDHGAPSFSNEFKFLMIHICDFTHQNVSLSDQEEYACNSRNVNPENFFRFFSHFYELEKTPYCTH